MYEFVSVGGGEQFGKTVTHVVVWVLARKSLRKLEEVVFEL